MMLPLSVGDADEGLGHGRDDLLAGQGCAAALDQVQVFVALVGAVDVELQVADGVQFIHRNAVALEARGSGFGAGNRAIERALVLGQGIDEAVGGGAGADPDDALVVEFRKDEVDGGLSHCLFELILGHAGSGSGQGENGKAGIIAPMPGENSCGEGIYPRWRAKRSQHSCQILRSQVDDGCAADRG
jgi:hypothetical protein